MASELVEAHGVPAVGLGVVAGGEVLTAVAGRRSYASEVAVDLDSPFHLGSNTKAITAVLIGTLVEDGSVSLDTPLGDVFGEAEVDPVVARATVRDLLAHRAGLGDQVVDLRALHDAVDAVVARGELALAAIADPAGSPGTFAYANVNYVVAAVIAERAGSGTWEDLVRGRVFGPLGIGCGFGAPTGAAVPLGHTRGGEPVPDDAPVTDNPAALRPAGGVHCTIGEWSRFVRVILAGIQGEDTDLLRARTFDELFAGEGDYHAGWQRTELDDQTLLVHDGSNTLWYARAVLLPRENRAFLVVTNTGEPKAVDAMDRFTRDQLTR